MKVLLLLAGKGSRFLPLSEGLPKPLIPVGGAPVLHHILSTISELEIEELIVVAGHLSEKISGYLSEYYSGAYRIVQQDKLNGTGGAVHAARQHITCPVLIVFGDTIFDVDLKRINNGQGENVIWTNTVEDFQRFGIVHADGFGNMKEIIEKPQTDIGRQANIGLYYISDYRALLAGLDRVMAREPIKGEYFITYALNDMVAEGRTIRVASVDGWHDCGNLTALIETNRYLLMRRPQHLQQQSSGVRLYEPVCIHESAQLENCSIGPNVTIEADCQIKSSTVRDTIVSRGCTIADVIVSNSLIGEGQTLFNTAIDGCIVAHGKTVKAA